MITKLNFNKASFFDLDGVLVFMLPLKSRLFRVFKLPSGYPPDKETEIEQVLTTICVRYHKGVWYFTIPDKETEIEFDQIFNSMGIAFIYVKLDNDPVLSN